MNRYWSILVLAMLCFSCREAEKSEQITLQIDIKKDFPMDFEVYDFLYLDSQAFYELTIDSLQNLVTFDFEEPAFCEISIWGQYVLLYLEKSYHLKISEQKNEFIFTGKGAAINNYLLEMTAIEHDDYIVRPENLSRKEIYEIRVDSLRQLLYAIEVKDLTKAERALVKKMLDVKLLNYKLQYLNLERHEGKVTPDIVLPLLPQIEKNRELFDLKFPECNLMLFYFLNIRYYMDMRKPPEVNRSSIRPHDFQKVDSFIRKENIPIKSKELLLVKNLSWSFRLTGLNENTDCIYQQFASEFPKSKFLESLEKKYVEMSN